MTEHMDDSPPDMPLILHNKPQVSKAYADYMINYREHPLPADFKHWHHSFHLGVHLEICNLPDVGTVLFVVKRRTVVMLTFDELNWLMAAEDSYERRDEQNVTKANLHFYLPDSRISIFTTAESDGVWQLLRFDQARDPPLSPAEIYLTRYEFAMLKGCLVSVMHDIVAAGGVLEEAGGVAGDVHHVVHKIVCPHCQLGGPLFEHQPLQLDRAAGGGGGDLVELPVDEVATLTEELGKQVGLHLDAHGEEILTPEELEEHWFKPERERLRQEKEKKKKELEEKTDHLPDCSCDCLPQ